MKKVVLIFMCLVTIAFSQEKVKLRAVSTAQFTTEMLLAIGAEDQMIGTSFLDDEILPKYKEKYDNIPVLSKKAPTKELFYSINPNFLIGWSSITKQGALGPEDELKENGVEVYLTKSQNSNKVEDIYIDILTLGEKFGKVENSKKVIEQLKSDIEEAKIISKGKKVKVFAYDSQEMAPFTIGKNGIGNTIIENAGGKNIFDDSSFSFGVGSWERVIDENPDYIIIVDYGNKSYEEKVKFLKERSPISDVSAVKNNRFIKMPLSSLSSGVRVGQAIKQLAKELYK